MIERRGEDRSREDRRGNGMKSDRMDGRTDE